MASPSVSPSLAALWLRGQSAHPFPTRHLLDAPSNQHAQMAASLPCRRFSFETVVTVKARARPRGPEFPPNRGRSPLGVRPWWPPPSCCCSSPTSVPPLLCFPPEQASQLPAVSRGPPSPLPASLGGAEGAREEGPAGNSWPSPALPRRPEGSGAGDPPPDGGWWDGRAAEEGLVGRPRASRPAPA